jgi:hypothetical protein
MYLQSQRVDMGALAKQLGISRATLHRWTGHRDQLLAHALWSLSDDTSRGASTTRDLELGRAASSPVLAVDANGRVYDLHLRSLQSFWGGVDHGQVLLSYRA